MLPDEAVRTSWFNLGRFIEGEYSDLAPGADLGIALCVIGAEQTGSAEATGGIVKAGHPMSTPG